MRQPEFDIMKGIGILLIMIGHADLFYGIEMPDIMHRFIFSFHVPLFFIIAGYFSKPYTTEWRLTIGKFAKRLLIPYLITALIIIVYNGLVAIKRGESGLCYKMISAFAFGDPSNYYATLLSAPIEESVGPLWFLLALFWTKAIFLFIARLGKWTVPVAILLSFAYSFVRFPLPFSINQGIMAVGFLGVGYWCKNHSIPIWAGIIGVLCWVACLIKPITFSAYMANYPMYLVSLVSASGATWLIYIISKGLAKLRYTGGLLGLIGGNSLNVLCAHEVDIYTNALHLILKHIPIVRSISIVMLIAEYVIVIVLSFIPDVVSIYKKRKNI